MSRELREPRGLPIRRVQCRIRIDCCYYRDSQCKFLVRLKDVIYWRGEVDFAGGTFVTLDGGISGGYMALLVYARVMSIIRKMPAVFAVDRPNSGAVKAAHDIGEDF